MPSNRPNGDRCITALGKLISFDTTSAYSNLELINYIKTELDQLGIECRLTYDEEKTKANLWATIGPAEKGGILLSGHTDVVPVAGQDWASDPFKMERRGDKLYGRGTCDMKGFVACALAHAKDMASRDLKTPVHFAFSYDEEVWLHRRKRADCRYFRKSAFTTFGHRW